MIVANQARTWQCPGENCLSPGLSVGVLRDYCKQGRRAAELEELLLHARSGARVRRLQKPAPARNELPADVVQAMVREYSRGASLYQLAARHDVRRNTVRDVLRRSSVAIAPAKTARLSPAEKAEIRERRAEGITLKALSELFDVCESTIKRALTSAKARAPKSVGPGLSPAVHRIVHS